MLHPRRPESDVIFIHHKCPRHGSGWPGQRQLTIHHRSLRGSVSDNKRTEKPRGQDSLRRRNRRSQEAPGLRGCLLQLLPLLFSGGAGPQAGNQLAQQQGCRRGLPGPHQSQSLEIWDDGFGFRVGDGLCVFGAVNGGCDSD